MPKCDICGEDRYMLQSLRQSYATAEIKHICDNCSLDVNRQLEKLQKITFAQNECWLKRFMRNMKKHKVK